MLTHPIVEIGSRGLGNDRHQHRPSMLNNASLKAFASRLESLSCKIDRVGPQRHHVSRSTPLFPPRSPRQRATPEGPRSPRTARRRLPNRKSLNDAGFVRHCDRGSGSELLGRVGNLDRSIGLRRASPARRQGYVQLRNFRRSQPRM